jgi:hypothetical protein
MVRGGDHAAAIADAIFAALPAAEEPPSDFGEQSAAHGQRLPKSVQRAIDKMSVPASPAPEACEHMWTASTAYQIGNGRTP